MSQNSSNPTNNIGNPSNRASQNQVTLQSQEPRNDPALYYGSARVRRLGEYILPYDQTLFQGNAPQTTPPSLNAELRVVVENPQASRAPHKKPGSTPAKYLQQEDDIILECRQRSPPMTFKDIHNTYLPNRTPVSIQSRFKYALDPRLHQQKPASSSTPVENSGEKGASRVDELRSEDPAAQEVDWELTDPAAEEIDWDNLQHVLDEASKQSKGIE
jgi:hypothetical protein